MADRYQERSYGAGHGRGGDQYDSARDDNDPLAELARLIGQSDPFAQARGGVQQQRQDPRLEMPQYDAPQAQDYYSEDDYAPEPEPEPEPQAPAGPPSWIQRANHRREAPQVAPREIPRVRLPDPEPEFEPESDNYLNAVHPLHRYAQQPQAQQQQYQPQQYQPPAPAPDDYYEEPPAYQPPTAYQQPAQYQQPAAYQPPVPYPQPPSFQQPAAYQQPQAYQHDPRGYGEPEQEIDPSRYDDALYGQLENGAQDFQREAAYPDDPYAYQGEYEEEEPQQKRRGVPPMVLAILGLGVFGFAAAYGYHSYFGAPRSGEIPIIKADNSPTKIVPAQSDANAKLPDRMAAGDGTEKMVPREEQPVDVNSRSVGPRVVFPPLNQNANPPSVASVTSTSMAAPPPQAAAGGPAPLANNGTMPNSEPRKIRTFSVKGDQPDPSAVPVGAAPSTTAPARTAKPPRLPANANASANAPLSLSPQAAPVETNTQVASTNPTQIAPSGGGGYLVSILSQPSESEARSAFRTLQGKYPSVLSSQSPTVTRATTKSGAVTYRAGVSFGTSSEAAQFCHSYESAGGQCWVVKN